MKLIPAGDFELQTTFFWIKPTLRAFSRVLDEFNATEGSVLFQSPLTQTSTSNTAAVA